MIKRMISISYKVELKDIVNLTKYFKQAFSVIKKPDQKRFRPERNLNPQIQSKRSIISA